MTAVASAAKMVGQLRRWLTGEDVAADGDNSVESMSGPYGTCACNSATSRLQYRGRSYSYCGAASCRSGCHDAAVRERSCSVNSRWMTSQGSRRMGLRVCPTSSGNGSASVRQRDVREVLDEDGELCRCWSRSVEPVCCCERCFVYVDEPPSVLPPPYSEVMLLERCADLADRLTNSKPSITVNTADVTDQLPAEATVNCVSSSAETCQLTTRQSDAMVSPICLVPFSRFLCSLFPSPRS